MNKINEHLQTLGIEEGYNIRTNCPVCGGKGTFTATKQDGVIIYNCYKVACGVRGMRNVGLTAYEIKQRLEQVHGDRQHYTQVEPMVWPEHVVTPSAEHRLLKRFIQRWDLHTEDLLYDLKGERAVFPITDKGVLIDAAVRALNGAVPKWYRYGGSADYYVRSMSDRNSVYVVVEDVISAITVAKKLPNSVGFAILGTSLTDKHLEYIQDNATKVIVALDPDALQKTLSYKKEIEMWTGLPSYALYLQDDLKYERPEDLDELRKLAYEEQDKPYG